ARERRAIVRAAFAHFGRLLFELLEFSTLPNDALLARVEFDGDERVRLAYAQGKGVLFVTGHFGFWELHAIVHALQFEPIGVVARALDNPYVNDLLERIRQRTGNFVLYRQGTIRRVMRTLEAGHGVAVLIDQHIQSRDAILVDFFERPAATTSSVAALALRTGAPVIPVFALPAIADIRRGEPDASITIAAPPSIAPLFDLVNGVRACRCEPSVLGGFVGTTPGSVFDAALLLPNSFHSAVAVFRAGIPKRWG